MFFKETILGPVLHKIAYVSSASSVRARRQPGGRIITFHGLGHPRYPAGVFEAQLLYLSRHFSIVPLARIVHQVRTRARPDPGEIALTFDDGLRNHYLIGYPLLQRLGLPATFFVCPGLIDKGQWQWPYEVRARLALLSDPRLNRFARTVGAPSAGREQLEEWMKTLPRKIRLDVEGRIRALTLLFKPTPEQHAMFDTMTWEELRSLDPRLITIGSHTASHPILTTLDPEELHEEIWGSRRWLEEKLQRDVDFFCYPNGDHDDLVVRPVRDCYLAAVTTRSGFVLPGDDLHLLPRISTAEQLPYLAWRLHRPTA